MRTQTECNLVLRLTWNVRPGHHHPEHTFDCAQDIPMARMMARRAAEFTSPRRAVRFVCAATSPDGGRTQPWEPLPLEDPDDTDGWLSGASATVGAC
jgi:hypothetical protein